MSFGNLDPDAIRHLAESAPLYTAARLALASTENNSIIQPDVAQRVKNNRDAISDAISDLVAATMVDLMIWEIPLFRFNLRSKLPRKGAVTKLDLSGALIDANGALFVAKALKGNEALTNLNLGSNLIGQDGRRHSPVRICTKGVAALAEALRGNTVLKDLDLSDNNINNEAGVSIFRALEENRSLTRLCMDHNLLGDAAAMALASAIRVNDTLKHLDIRCNYDIDIDAAQVIATAILFSPSLESFGLFPLHKLRTGNIDQLDLTGMGIGKSEIFVLANLLDGNSGLKSLRLSSNGICDSGAVAIAAALPGNMVLTKLDLSFNKIRNVGAGALSAALRVNVSLKNLRLDNNEFEESGKEWMQGVVSGRDGFLLVL